jgi:saccharopine dehydrogenase (NADP+, L-glutamate forming)
MAIALFVAGSITLLAAAWSPGLGIRFGTMGLPHPEAVKAVVRDSRRVMLSAFALAIAFAMGAERQGQGLPLPGLSSGPGLRRLLENGHKVVVWNRTVSKAQEVVGSLTTDIRPYSLDALTAALAPGDIAISMLPADQHVAIAKACLAKGANFVSSSYIAPEMRALDPEFKAKGLVSVNEVGLDPGIDHLMAHDLVARYRASPAYHADNVLSFTSYCGGVPKIANAFKYKFSWAPVGVLKALRSPSRSLRNASGGATWAPWASASPRSATT